METVSKRTEAQGQSSEKQLLLQTEQNGGQDGEGEEEPEGLLQITTVKKN